MGSYNAKSITADDKDHRIQPANSWNQPDSQNSHPFTIEDTSDTDGDEANSTNSRKEASVKQLLTPSATVMQDEQQQPELAQERHREETRGPSGGSAESVSPYGVYNPLAASDGGRPFPAGSVASAVAGSGMNAGTLPLIQYPGQPAPPLVAITPSSSTAVFAPYPSAFTSPAVGIYSSLHSSTPTRQYHGAVESYSAMLANMGNQAQQQHLQGHLIPAPSYFQAGYVPAQYTPLSPLMAGVVPTSKGIFSEGSYLPTAVGPTVLTGIVPGGNLNPALGGHGDSPSGERGRSPSRKNTTRHQGI